MKEAQPAQVSATPTPPKQQDQHGETSQHLTRPDASQEHKAEPEAQAQPASQQAGDAAQQHAILQEAQPAQVSATPQTPPKQQDQHGETSRDTCQANINKLFDPNRYKQKQTSTNSPDEPSSKNNTMQERHQRGEITRDTCQANINKLFDPNRYKQKQTSTNSPDEPSSKNNTLQERHQRGEITRDTCQANINKLFDTNVYKRKQTSTNSPDEPSNKKAQQVHCGQDDDMLPRQPDELMMFVRLNEFHMEKLLREPL